MGLFDDWKKQWDTNRRLTPQDLQQKYLTDFEKGKVNRANELSQGLVLSVLELGKKAGLTSQETLDAFNKKIASQPAKLDYDNKIIGAAGEIVAEMTVAAPASTLGWFGTGGKLAQIYKQGMFGGAWEYLTNPTKVGQERVDEAVKTGAVTAGATAALGVLGRPIEKITNFDFKENIKAVRDASAALGVSPRLLGDFTAKDATLAAEALSKSRGGGALPRLKENVNELARAAGDVEQMFTKGTVYSGKAGENVAKAIQTNYREATAEGNRLYGILDRVAKEEGLTKVAPTETRATLQNVLTEYSDLFRTLERPALEAKLNAMAGKVGAQEVKQPASVILSEAGVPIRPEVVGPVEFSFRDIRNTREALTDALQAAKNSNKLGSSETNRLREVIEAMDNDIETWGASAASQNAKVAGAWQDARNWWKGNVVPLRDADLTIAMIRDPNSGELKADIAKLVGKIVSAESTGQEGAKRAAMMVSKVLPDDVKQDVTAAIFSTARREATDAAGNFDPVKFSTFLQSRKQNLQPFVEENLDTMLNKFSFLANRMSRSGGPAQSLDDVGTTALRVAGASAIGGAPGAAIAAVPANRIMEALSRAAFDTSAGRALMLSAKTLDDFRPLLTGGIAAQEGQIQEGVSTPAAPQFEMPPDLIPEQAAPSFQLPPEFMPEIKDKVSGLIDEEAKRLGISEYAGLLKNMARRESNFDPLAVSKKGAIGVMQLMPATARELGVNPDNLEENVRGGVKYWEQMFRRFDNDPTLATAAYNAGPQRVIDAGYKVPDIAETRQYVADVFQ